MRRSVARLIGSPFVAADIGARGDLPRHWLPLDGHADIFAFDADPGACSSLARTYARRGHGERYHIHPVALGRADEARPLYQTRGGGATSLFRPDTDLVRRYADHHYSAVVEVAELQVRHAGRYFEEIGLTDVDLLKADIQGAELEVFEALAGILPTVVALETEVQFHDRGNGMPAFCDIHQFLVGQGFELLDLGLARQHPTTRSRRAHSLEPFGVVETSPSIARRLWFGDALYFRGAVTDPRKLDNLLTCLCLYGFFTEAMAALQRAEDEGRMPAAEAEWRRAQIVDWHRQRYRWRYGRSRPARLCRWLLGYFDLREHPPWSWRR